MTGTSRAVVCFYNQRGTAEQWIKEGKAATHWTRLSCHCFRCQRVADEHGSDVVVLLGTPDAESTQTLAQTVVAGDPSYAGPLAGVPLGHPVFHVFEPGVRDQVPGDVDEAQVALMEMSLERDAILVGLREARRGDLGGSEPTPRSLTPRKR